MARKYTPREIVEMLEAQQDAGRIAMVIEAFWPTIKDALLAYHDQTAGKLVKSRNL
jgi:hypothetical protein